MKTEDIIVGKLYRSLELGSNSKWLGVGMRQLFTGPGFENEEEFVSKHLVCVESENPSHIGYMLQEGENAREGLWDEMVACDDPEWQGIFIARTR